MKRVFFHPIIPIYANFDRNYSHHSFVLKHQIIVINQLMCIVFLIVNNNIFKMNKEKNNFKNIARTALLLLL